MPGRTAGRGRRLQAWLLAGLLLTPQALGLAHRVEHASGLAGVVPAAVAAPAQAQKPHLAQAAGPTALLQAAAWLDGHDADTATCRLIDQLAHADGLCSAVVAGLPVAPAPDTRARPTAAAPAARPAAAYQARAPPRA